MSVELKAKTEQTVRQRIVKETLDWKKRIKYLPQDTDDVAKYYADKTRCILLKDPLGCFLDQASSIQGLGGLALVMVDEGPFKFLEVYIFTNHKEWRDDNSLASQAARKTGEAYGRLQGAIWRYRPQLSTGAWFVSTGGRNFTEVIPRFLDSLAVDPWSFNSKDTKFSHFTFLQISRKFPS